MADKKISELPLITAISGSIVYVPIVHDGITEKITVENFSNFTNKYAAQTGSVNIFTANQTINANLSVNGTSTISGNASVGGNLTVAGVLTAQEYYSEITSASIIYSEGSTIFGNSGDDTHQFTGIVSINGVSIGAGAINEFTASQLAVNLRIASTTGSINTTTSSFDSEFIKIGSTTSSIHFTTQSLNTQTGSQDLVNLRISSTTGSINTTTSSFDSVFLRISSTTGSINTTTSSFDSVFLRISSTTGSINTTTSSFDSEFIKIGSTTSSIHFTTQSLNTQTGSQANLNAQIGIATASLNFSTGALNAFTGSVIGQTNTISTFTASVNFTTQSLNTQTGSQNSINFNISVVTASIDAHILKQATQTGSQDLVNYQNSIITSSYRIELNSIEAYTSSLKSAITVNGSNVQIIGELNVNKLNVQYISSSVLLTSGSNIFGDAVTDKHEFTGSVNIKDTLFVDGQAIGLTQLNSFTGSQIGKDLTLSIVTSSIDAHILKQATQTGSQDLVNYNISVYTGSQNVINNSVNSHILAQSTQTGSQDLINYNISVYTGSQNVINTSVNSHILAQSTQTGSQDLVNLGISTFTGSLRSEVNLIEAYTASLKGAAIVSSSQQITNYYKFAETASANTFYGNQSISGSVGVNKSSNGGSGNDFPRLKVQNSLPTQGDGSSTFNFADILISSGNEAVNMFLATTYAAGSWAPAGIINVATNHGLQIKTNNTTALNIASGGDVTVSTGNLVIGTAGKGIDFSATSNGSGTTTSELLNDYEEGEWTPTFTTGTSGTITVDAVNTKARYTKIGRQVTVAGSFYVTSVSSPVGEWRIQGLPFTSNTGTSLRSAVSVFADGLETTATTSIIGYVDPNVTYITLYKYAAGVVSTMAADVKAGSYVFLTATYNV